MKSSRILWNCIGLISMITTCVFLFGVGYAIKTVVYPQTTNMPQPREVVEDIDDLNTKEDIQILALGDSLTKGMGDQSSLGYVRPVQAALEQLYDKPVKLINYAINGYQTNQLLDDISNNKGTIRAIQTAEIILLTIGGNDLFSIGNEVDIDQAMSMMPDALENIEQILYKLDTLNSTATIIYVGLYNPFMELTIADQSSMFIQVWNSNVFRIMNQYDNMTLIPTFDLFERDVNKYLSSDQFHPNQAGYERIADRVIQALQ